MILKQSKIIFTKKVFVIFNAMKSLSACIFRGKYMISTKSRSSNPNSFWMMQLGNWVLHTTNKKPSAVSSWFTEYEWNKIFYSTLEINCKMVLVHWLNFTIIVVHLPLKSYETYSLYNHKGCTSKHANVQMLFLS